MAASRIGLGLLVLIDCAQRAPVLADFYTDAGFVPRTAAYAVWAGLFPNAPPQWSLHALSGSLSWQIMLLALEAAAALALVVGYWTRIASIACFVLFISHCQRNALVCDAQDWALVAFLLWACFVPLDRAWTVGRRRFSPAFALGGLDVGTFAFTAQLVMLLFFAGLQKLLNSEAWRSGGAVEVVLRLEIGVTPLGHALADFPAPLLRAVDYGVLASEIVAPWLLIVPVPRRVRSLALVLIAAHLLAFWACLDVGLLPWIVLAALLSRLPGEAWDFVGSLAKKGRTPAASSTGGRRVLAWVVVAGAAHAFLLNVLRLSGEYRGPDWFEAPGGFLVPRQGWRMYSTLEASSRSTWIVLTAQPADPSRAAIRLPDAAPLSYGPESSADVLAPTLRERLFWTYAQALHEQQPDVLERVARRQCSSLPIRRFEIVLVQRVADRLSRSLIAEYRCA